MRSFRSGLAVLCATVLVLAACGKDKRQVDVQALAAAGATPAVAVQNSARLLKAGDFDAFWQHVLPPADYQALRTDWNKDDDAAPVTDPQRRKFAETMAELTAPDAEATLFAKVQPTLADYRSKYSDQLPVMIAIGQSVLATQADSAGDLSLAQKQHAKDVLATLAQWARQAPWGDADKARQAVAVVVVAARKLDLQTLDQARALDYDDSMQRYTTSWAGLKQLLAIYGLSLDQALDSVKTKTVEAKGATATVELGYILRGNSISTDLAMVRENGRWYDADLLNAWRRRHAAAMVPHKPVE